MIFALLLWACDDTSGDAGCALPLTWYVDSDGDGFHAGILPVEACTEPEDGYVLDGGDCDDGDITTAPGAPELCDGLDNDCDGEIDEDQAAWYRDEDGDGYGGTTSTSACAAPDGYVGESGDCDDEDSATYPGAPELCDGADNGCGAWDASQEAGVASSVDADGVWSNIDAPFVISAPGTLWLCEGTYFTTVEIEADAEVRGRGAVTLDAGGAGPAVSVSAGAAAQLAGLVLQGGSTDSGGGLLIGAGAAVVVTDSVISGNVASASGGGVYTDGGAVTLVNVEVLDNVASSGGGIALEGGSSLSVEGGTIHGNTATDGGGVYASGTSKVTIEMVDTQLRENRASGRGGAMSVDMAAVSLEGVVMQGNVAVLGGGGVVVTYATLDLIDTALTENTSAESGAALYLDDHATVTCTSSAGSTSSSLYGVYSNEDTYAVYINDFTEHDDANTLQSSGCDWGLDADDNDKGDVYMGKLFDFALDESFTCMSDAGCR